MKAEKLRERWKTSGIGRQSAVSVLLFIVCFVSMFQFFYVHPFPLLQDLDVSAHPAVQYRLPYSVMSEVYSLRQEGFAFRTVHLAANTAFDSPVSQPSLARKVEYVPKTLVVSMLADSGLEARAPPRCLFF